MNTKFNYWYLISICAVLFIVLLIIVFLVKINVIQSLICYSDGNSLIVSLNQKQYSYVSHYDKAYYIDIENNDEYLRCYLFFKEATNNSYLFYCNIPDYEISSSFYEMNNFKFGDLSLIQYWISF